MKRPLTTKEIREMPEPKEIQDLMIEVVSAFRIAEGQACGNIALAYWRGKQEPPIDKIKEGE